ncbi:hypothetical protein AB1E22_17125 [Buttiauxella gaviniae]|uniref:AAA+ ATPase domain-containing protein n=1 Tax=Buttiauxella gaviniae TaxID=82990 RepID=A0ABV3NXX0_9ENTR
MSLNVPPLRLALTGPSGSGKTYSALLIANLPCGTLLYAAPQLQPSSNPEQLEPVSEPYKLPMQVIVFDSHGTLRFKENQIVRKLLDFSTAHGYGLNEMALDDFSDDDRMQLAQLIGYSLSGYGTLSYVSDESYCRDSASAPNPEVS